MQRQRPRDDRGRDGSDGAIGQGILRTAENTQELEVARTDPLLEPSERAWPADTLISDFEFPGQQGNRFLLLYTASFVILYYSFLSNCSI